MKWYNKRCTTTLTLLPCAVCMLAGRRVTIKGVQYETAEDNTAAAALTVQAKGDVTVMESVEVGKLRYLVTEMRRAYSSKNSGITSVTLPNSLKVIGEGAFRGCAKLSKVTFPTGEYTIEEGAFEGCNLIGITEGNIIPYLTYAERHTGGEQGAAPKTYNASVPKFSTFAEKTLRQRMTLWQQKKDYETAEQYRSRMTDENRRKRMDEFLDELKSEYVTRYAPSNISTRLGYYDSEYGVYTVQTSFFGNVFAMVPKADAASFKQNYAKVEVLPRFHVQGDTLAIKSCQFRLNGKTYDNMTNYAAKGGGDVQFDLPPLDIRLGAGAASAVVDNSIDKNIPRTKKQNEKTFALIIGNEQYKRVATVPFAGNDAKVFAEYCKKTLGLPANNVKLYLNASLNDMRHAVTALVNTLKAYDGEAQAIVYYAGHGLPDEQSRLPYLLPTDGFATDMKSGYSLSDLYDELATAPSKMTVVLLDACFSGAQREGDMLASARGVAIKPRNTVPEGNLLVFSASQGDETAYPDRQHGHGMFTYYLLKHLQDTEGNTTLSKLTDYVITNVKRSSVVENEGKMQTPTIIPSLSLLNSWQNMWLR